MIAYLFSNYKKERPHTYKVASLFFRICLCLCSLRSYFREWHSLVILWEIFGGGSVHSGDDYVITFIWLKSHLIDRAELLFAQDLYFVSIDNFWSNCRVDTWSLDSNDEVATILYKHWSIETENTGLIRLCNIGARGSMKAFFFLFSYCILNY